MRTLALFLPNWIGDVVMATPAIRALRSTFPESRILGICTEYVAETIHGNPHLNRILTFEKRRPFPLLRELRRERVRDAVLFANTFRSALLARWAGCERIVGFARYFRDALLTDRLYPRRDHRGRYRPTPVLDDYNRLAMRYGAAESSVAMQLETAPGDEAQALRTWNELGLNRFSRVVGLNPGGAFGSSKHWPVSHFAELAGSLSERGYGVLVFCGPAERETARAIVHRVSHPAVVGLADRAVSLGLSKALIRKLALLVTTDSGPRHFATAFGIPVVTLFGPTHQQWTETYARNAIPLQLALPCGPCQQRVCPEGHHRCMTELQPQAVLDAVNRLLAPEVRRAG